MNMAHISVETYKKMEMDFNEIALTQKKYKNKSVHDWISEMITKWGKVSRWLWIILILIYSYCTFMEKDRRQFLREIFISSLYNFFHWLFTVCWESFWVASSLQTYWNVFGFIRKKETSLMFIDPTIKTQMTAVKKPRS